MKRSERAAWLLDMPASERRSMLERLGERQRRSLRTHWRLWAHPAQLPPEGEWLVWLIMAGRGFGKTRAGSEWVRQIAETDPQARIALVAASLGEARSVMVEGESGLLAISPYHSRPRYEPSKRQLQWPSGAQATLYSAGEPESLRGPQHSHAWCDEIAKWDLSGTGAEQCWDNLLMGMRLGSRPRLVATTTPRAVPLLKRLAAADRAIATHNAAADWNRQLLENAARPSGALVFDGGDGATLTADQFDRLKSELAMAFAGHANASRPMLLDGGLKWQSMSMSPADMDFAELKAAAARDIALAFGVPPMLLGLPGDATYANYREANRALWRLTLLPMAAKLLGALAEGLATWFPSPRLAIDLDRVSALAEDRERLWSQVSSADFLSNAEKRAMLGLAQEGQENK